MPRPPLVIASMSACDIVQRKMNANADRRRCGLAISSRIAETIAAKQIECVKPRWPNVLAYGTPSANPMTSASGSMEPMMPATNTFLSHPNQRRKPTATAGCERMVGNQKFFHTVRVPSGCTGRAFSWCTFSASSCARDAVM